MAIAASMTLGQLTAILDSAIEGLIAVDPEGRVVLFNERAGEIMQARPVASALGRPVREVVPNSRLPDVLASGQDELNRRMDVGATTIVTSMAKTSAARRERLTVHPPSFDGAGSHPCGTPHWHSANARPRPSPCRR